MLDAPAHNRVERRQDSADPKEQRGVQSEGGEAHGVGVAVAHGS